MGFNGGTAATPPFQPHFHCFSNINLRLSQVQTCFSSTAPRSIHKQCICPLLGTPRYKTIFLNTCITDRTGLPIAVPAKVDSRFRTSQCPAAAGSQGSLSHSGSVTYCKTTCSCRRLDSCYCGEVVHMNTG